METALSAQIGYALELTVNTYVPPSQFVGLIPGGGIKREINKLKSKAIYAGRRAMISEQVANGNETLSGTFNHELVNDGLEDIFSLMWGAATESGAGPYVRTYNFKTMLGLSATVQGGRPGTNGTVYPFTWTGTKCTGYEIGLVVDEFATLSVDLVAMNEILHRTVTDGATTSASAAVTSATAAFTSDDVGKPISGTGIPANTTILTYTSATAVTLSANCTATAASVTFTIGVALTAASYPTTMRPFTFVEGSVTVAAAAPTAVKSAKITGTNGLDVDRRTLGSAKILQPLEAELRTVKFELDCEFDSLTHYRRYIANTEHAAVLSLSNGDDTFVLTGNGYYEMPPDPQVSDSGVVRQTIGIDCVATSGGGADTTAFQAVLTNDVV